MTFVVFVFLLNSEKNFFLLAQKVRNMYNSSLYDKNDFLVIAVEKQKYNINKFWVIKMTSLLFLFLFDLENIVFAVISLRADDN